MIEELRTGIALYNAGHYHAAHDAWEPVWLESEGADARFLQGLIQYTAAIHHARGRNWAGATGLAGSAVGYLEGLPDEHRGVELRTVRSALASLEDDPEWIERTHPPRLAYRGRDVSLPDLDAEECLLAAPIVAEACGFDAGVVERACEYAHGAFESGGSNAFLALCTDFVREPDRRDLVHRRLADRVSRRRARERDVDGLFDPGT
ncbi:MAG: DUF309 domain-containing protein [Halalkalicoccus sp.]